MEIILLKKPHAHLGNNKYYACTSGILYLHHYIKEQKLLGWENKNAALKK